MLIGLKLNGCCVIEFQNNIRNIVFNLHIVFVKLKFNVLNQNIETRYEIIQTKPVDDAC